MFQIAFPISLEKKNLKFDFIYTLHALGTVGEIFLGPHLLILGVNGGLFITK